MADQKKDFKKRFNQVWNPIRRVNHVIFMLSHDEIPTEDQYALYQIACSSSSQRLQTLMEKLSEIPDLLTNEINRKSIDILRCLKLLQEADNQANGLRKIIRNRLTEIVAILKSKRIDLFSKVPSRFEFA